MRSLLLYLLFITYIFNAKIYSQEIDMNFSKLTLSEFIKISSQILKKEIVFTQNLDIKIDFVASNSINKDEIPAILDAILDENGYFLEDYEKFYKISKKNRTKTLKEDVLIYELKNSEVDTIFKILEEFIQKEDFKKRKKPIVTKNLESNSLIIFADTLEQEKFKKLIDNLDKEKEQIYIEAKIIELNSELVNRVGVSYGINAASSSSSGIMALSTKLNGGSLAIDEAITNLGIDIKNQNLKSGVAFSASLNLLHQKGALNVVSEPSILAINNKESFIYVGEKISMQTSSSVTDGGTSKSNYDREDIGLTLKVKPRVSQGNRVILEINTLLEGLKINSVGAGENPDTLKKEINTSAILNNGESVIIGGLIENKSEEIEDKVPFFGDLPIIGALFRNKYKQNRKNNLLVIVTPYIVPKDEGVSFIREKLAKLKEIEDKYLRNSLEELEKENKEQKKEESNDDKKVDIEKRLNHEERYKRFLEVGNVQSDSF